MSIWICLFFLKVFGDHLEAVGRQVGRGRFEEFDFAADVTIMVFHL